jgi:hypothetical protein
MLKNAAANALVHQIRNRTPAGGSRAVSVPGEMKYEEERRDRQDGIPVECGNPRRSAGMLMPFGKPLTTRHHFLIFF